MAEIRDICRITSDDSRQMERILKSPGVGDLDEFQQHLSGHLAKRKVLIDGPREFIASIHRASE